MSAGTPDTLTFCRDFHSAFQQTLEYYPGWALTTYFRKTLLLIPDLIIRTLQFDLSTT
jgi:hypothetical protein